MATQVSRPPTNQPRTRKDLKLVEPRSPEEAKRPFLWQDKWYIYNWKVYPRPDEGVVDQIYSNLDAPKQVITLSTLPQYISKHHPDHFYNYDALFSGTEFEMKISSFPRYGAGIFSRTDFNKGEIIMPVCSYLNLVNVADPTSSE